MWGPYLVAVGYLAFRMFQRNKGPSEGDIDHPRLGLALVLSVPISVIAGLLGVGPGFLLMPVLIVAGAAGSFLGARLTSRFVSGPTLKRVFGILIVVMTTVKVVMIGIS